MSLLQQNILQGNITQGLQHTTHWSHHHISNYIRLRFNSYFHSLTWIAGAQDRASVKQIIHMSSASCLRASFDEQPCRHGKHTTSPLIPPHIWPHGCSLLQALRACSCCKEQTADIRLCICMSHQETSAVHKQFIIHPHNGQPATEF